ncbi:cupin domain-containing protein [Euzebya pacifica]|uniref:cupin domain-containing protein n=1 Tax=Euzebya pacifica TaxID=1608957 RepID=UPI000DF79C95|nr:cupin domain-containing protein [Euzebya pacifica]
MGEGPVAFVVRPDEGTHLRGPAGGPSIIKARAETTGGVFAFLQVGVGPGQGPPEHVHANEDEMWFVHLGDFRFLTDGRLLDAPEKSFVFVPRGTSHCFQNVTDEPGEVLVMFTPGGMERFFELHAALPAGPADPAAYGEIAAACAMTVTGPPLGTRPPGWEATRLEVPSTSTPLTPR